MPTPLSRSLRSVEGDGGRLGPVLVLVALWGWWLVAAEVPLYAASASARLVHERAVYALQSAVDGRVLAVHVQLEQAVEAGALVLELDASGEELALAEERARVTALEGEIAAAHTALEALAAARTEAQASATATRAEAELELETRRITLRNAREEAERLSQLEDTGDVSKIAAARARADAEKAAV